MKKLSSVVLLVTALAGCGGSTTALSASTSQTEQEPSFAKVTKCTIQNPNCDTLRSKKSLQCEPCGCTDC